MSILISKKIDDPLQRFSLHFLLFVDIFYLKVMQSKHFALFGKKQKTKTYAKCMQGRKKMNKKSLFYQEIAIHDIHS